MGPACSCDVDKVDAVSLRMERRPPQCDYLMYMVLHYSTPMYFMYKYIHVHGNTPGHG